jgi:hypothetical protein
LFIPWHFPLHTDSAIQGASAKAEQAFKEQYPAIYNHLLQYKTELSNRNKAETGIRYEWYALQRWGANYMNDNKFLYVGGEKSLKAAIRTVFYDFHALMNDEISYLFPPPYIDGKFEKLLEDNFKEIDSLNLSP